MTGGTKIRIEATQLSANDPAVQSPLSRFNGERPAAPAWFDALIACEPKSTFVECNGNMIEVLEWGEESDRPSLLLLHGSGASADWWRFVAPFLARNVRVVALTWSGMGRSGWRPTYSFEKYADEAISVAVQVGLFDIGRSPILVGHSMGGIVGTLCASRNDVRFLGAVVIDSNILDYAPPRDWEFLEDEARIRSSEWPAYNLYPTIAEALSRYRFLPPQAAENNFITDFIARANLRQVTDPGGKTGWTWRSDPKLRYLGQQQDFFAKRLPHVNCPLAMVRGGQSALISAEAFERTLKIAPADTVSYEIPNAGHHVIVDQPIALAASLNALFTSWPSRRPKASSVHER